MKRLSVTKFFRVVFMIMLGVWLVGCSDSNHNSLTSPDVPSDADLKATYQATIHAILAVDDLDPSIGYGDALDIANINQWITDASQNTGFPTDITVLSASSGNLTAAALGAAISSVKARIGKNKNDIVIFWYSGHGAANEYSGATKWPLMAFQDPSGEYSYSLVDFNEVRTLLKGVGAKLLIAAADCCNNYSWQSKTMGLPRANLPKNFLTLFKKSGYIIMSGAKPGEFSIGTDVGGLFTLQFLNAFYANINLNNPNWKTLTKNATQVIAIESNVQHPQLEIKIN